MLAGPTRYVALVAVLCAFTAFGHKLKSNRDTGGNDRYVALIHEMNSADTGADLEDAKMADLADSIQGVFNMDAKRKQPEAKVVEDINTALPFSTKIVGKLGRDTSAKSAQAEKRVEGKIGHSGAQQKLKLKLPIEGKVGHVNVSAAAHTVKQNLVKENRAKAVEEAAVTLPKASFALHELQPAKNNEVHKLPSNSTQKAAWEKNAKSVEAEVLKTRLPIASESMPFHKKAALPAAKGTFHAELHDQENKPPEKFMASKESVQTHTVPAVKDEKPEVNRLSMTALDEPVGVHEVSGAGPPQKELSQPHGKAESEIALDATVEHGAAVYDDDSSDQAASTSSSGTWFSSFYSWLTGKPPSTIVSKSTVVHPVHHTELSRKAGSFTHVKQDSERTAQATHDQHQHSIEVNDAWTQMEKDDGVVEDIVRGEDVAARRRAETPELAYKPTKLELQGRHGAAVSGFWKQLENEDNSIEETVQSDDLVKYAELTQAQDVRVAKASDQLDSSKLSAEHAPLDHSDTRLAIHEFWLHRELRDRAIEREVRASRDLQMLQLQHHHRRK